ncbi:WcbI family polysaccharide biosynthesis putative acetyltransferase [Frigoribacterium sp. 2-23]|uniref:WcbI family polysaccharide biosynthesis putative acetyltransferase n=1 Tax=Frigoribacterium sp. 2-23 TaxID=3415006 RepID=UPI003C7031D2
MSDEHPEPDGRTRHYGDFYGLSEPAGEGDVTLVIGNCQAESLRIFLDGGGLRTVRTPPIHELVEADLPHLQRWLARTRLLVAQPIRDGYHGMPLGTAELAAVLPGGGRLVRVPVIRFAGLYPAHVIVRPPSDPSLVPPLVEYHDIRTIAEAAGQPLAEDALTPDLVRRVAELSLSELRRREVANDTVVASDLFAAPSFDQMRTLNHPGNPVFAALAARVRERAGVPAFTVDPGRPVLVSVHAPRERAVLDAWSLDGEPTDHWVVGGAPIDSEEVRRAHLAWYAAHPDAVAAALARHADTLRLWRAITG